MNELEQLHQEAGSKLTVRRMTRRTLLVAGIGLVLYSCLLLPLYTNLSANVLYNGTWWLQLIGLASEAVDLAVLLVMCPFTAYAIWVGGWKYGYPVPVAYTILMIVKYLANYMATCIMDGALPSAEIVAEDLPIILPMFGLEFLQYCLITAFCLLHTSLWKRRAARNAETASSSGETAGTPAVLPVTRLLDLHNPIPRALFDSALVLLIFRVTNHLIYQMTLIVFNGAPDSGLQIAVDLIGDVIVAVVCYLAGLLIVNRLHESTVRRQNT